MKKLWLGALVAVLLPAGALGQPAGPAWTLFVDPGENAFAFEVPQGWRVEGGVRRRSPVFAAIWITAVSPDGAMQIFVGDPELPRFIVPKGDQAEGTKIKIVSNELPPAQVLRYRAGAEFAEWYAPSHLATAGCAAAAATGRQAIPQVADASFARDKQVIALAKATSGISLPADYQPPQREVGLATFACTATGGRLAAGVIGDTTRPGADGIWMVKIAGYLALPAKTAEARAVLSHALVSERYNPQWQQAMIEMTEEALAREHRIAAQPRPSAGTTLWPSDNYDEFIAEMNAPPPTNQSREAVKATDAKNNKKFRNYMEQQNLNTFSFAAETKKPAPEAAAAQAPVKWTMTVGADKIRYYVPDRSIEVADWQAARKLLPRGKDDSSVWSIFDHPRDHPQSFVIRETVAAANAVITSPAAIYAATLEEARAKLPPHSTKLPKDPSDPKNLIEVWASP